MLIPFAVGAVVALAAVAALAGGGERGDEPAVELPLCTVALFLMAPGKGDAVGEAIDLATGGGGFSHIATGGCELDEKGEMLVYDCAMGRGVTRGPLSRYAGRHGAIVTLEREDAQYLLGCLRAKLGSSYGEAGTLQCAQLVRDCLPAKLASKIAEPATPNGIAAAFDVTEADVTF